MIALLLPVTVVQDAAPSYDPVRLYATLAFMFVFMRVVYLSLPIGAPPFSVVSLQLMQWMGIR